MSPPSKHVRYGHPERFYDTDTWTTRLVKRRYEMWVVDGQRVGRWDYVPASASEWDAKPQVDSRPREGEAVESSGRAEASVG